jgi:hypothetical protein
VKTEDPSRELVEQRLEELLARVGRMPDEDLALLRSAWNGGDAQARAVAWQKAKRAIEARGRDDLMNETRERLAGWAHGQRLGFALEYGNLMADPRSMLAGPELRRDALPPLLDAIAAIVASGGLDADDTAVLLEPLSVLSPPQA